MSVDVPAADSKTVRITADFSPEAYGMLNEISSLLGTSKADAIRRALGLYSFMLNQKNEDWKLYLERNGERKQIVTL